MSLCSIQAAFDRLAHRLEVLRPLLQLLVLYHLLEGFSQCLFHGGGLWLLLFDCSVSSGNYLGTIIIIEV